MASGKEYLNFVLDSLSGIDNISYRAMMGEYVLYYRGKIFGGIYDDRLLIKPINSAMRLMPDAPREKPYEGGKEMLLAENIDDKAWLSELVLAMYEELPAPRKKN